MYLPRLDCTRFSVLVSFNTMSLFSQNSTRNKAAVSLPTNVYSVANAAIRLLLDTGARVVHILRTHFSVAVHKRGRGSRKRTARSDLSLSGSLWCILARQTLEGSFSAVSKPDFASKYALESSRRDLHNAPFCTALQSQFFVKFLPTFLPTFFATICKIQQIL